MVDNRYATALVLGAVLSALATAYLSAAVATRHWYRYLSPGARGPANLSELRALHEEFRHGEFDEKTYGDALVPPQRHAGPLVALRADDKRVMECWSFTLPQQFTPKYKEPGNHNSGEDMLRTCLCTLATVCCYLAGMDLLHRASVLPDGVDGALGWSLYLALVSAPLHMMAAALLIWAARSHSRNYYRMTAYRVA
ncbi:hypothetical protein CRUP_023650 [Coryphaenoides rupestris]|nr:hypothetical protein CRUP_023650 [Coryphaenoides rupestris]